MADDKRAGLLVLHGNRLELLAESVFGWLASHPLGALEQETILVQSNGMAEWLKMELAGAQGVCASTRVELPARFVWRAYRAVLGREAVPSTSALDKLPLTWRLMHLLAELEHQPAFAALGSFLGHGDAARRLQLAQRLADLFDQYQVYRSDWLQDWGRGADLLRTGPQDRGLPTSPLADDQRWQPALWRRLQSSLTAAQQDTSRAALQQRLWRCITRCCWRYPIPAATTGPTSSTAASCCASNDAASRCGASGSCRRCRCRTCTPTATPCRNQL